MPVIEIENQQINYELRQARGRGISLKFNTDTGRLVVATPEGQLTPSAQKFIQQKRNWILKNYGRVQDMYQQRQQFLSRFERGEMLYMGTWYPYQILQGKQRRVKLKDDQITIVLRPTDGSPKPGALFHQALRALSKPYLKRRTLELANYTGVEVNRIFIKNQKSKWGSCSSKQNINLNWHVILLPQHLIDYLIVHELMHLKEMNHSPRFWKWVETYYPTYKEAEKELKAYSWIIGVFE